MEEKKVLLSGIKPTGRSHMGNYLGAMEQFLELQDEYESYIFIPDYHSLTTVHNAKEREELIINIALDYLAIGLDPEKVVFFKQSDVPQHTELTWIFNCITTMPYLMRAHAFKDAEAKNKDIDVGTFDYPILMATDILLYDPDIVPTGQDQKQHVEIARDTAEKFNRIYGDVFKLPESRILDSVAVIPGTDGQKMSKSHKNTIELFAEDDEIDKSVMSIVTDSKAPTEPKDPYECTVFLLHTYFSESDVIELEKRYKEGDIGYKESKELLSSNIKKFVKPLREKRHGLAKNKDYVLRTLERGGMVAFEKAESKMRKVRKLIGVSLY